MSNYAIISLGGKQYRVREGEKLLVDRVSTDEGKTFHPDVLFTGGDGKAEAECGGDADGTGAVLATGVAVVFTVVERRRDPITANPTSTRPATAG